MNHLPLLCLIPSVIGQMISVNQDINASKNGSSGAFTSPGYPNYYPNNLNYTWTLTTGDSNAKVVINITDFSVIQYRGTPNCEDYLKIEMIEPHYALIMNRCGEIVPHIIKYTGKIFVVTFVSDSIHNARGFYLSWKVYIRDTTTTTPTTTTTKITKFMTRTKTTTETTKTTTPRTTNSPIQIIKKSTREIHTSSSALLTLNQKQPMTHTNGLFTRDTEAYVTNENAHSTTEKREKMLTKTDSVKKTTILITKQQIAVQNNTTEETLGTKEILYLVAGIGVVELTLVALGIYIVKQRRTNTRQLNTGKPDKEKNRPVSRKSVASVGNIYESIPMEHFTIKDSIPEEDENVYTEVPEHMYDKTFEHRPRVNVNANLYQLISELKTKNR